MVKACVGLRIDLCVSCVAFIVPPMIWGGGIPLCFTDVFFPRINSRYGVGFLRNAVPVADY